MDETKLLFLTDGTYAGGNHHSKPDRVVSYEGFDLEKKVYTRITNYHEGYYSNYVKFTSETGVAFSIQPSAVEPDEAGQIVFGKGTGNIIVPKGHHLFLSKKSEKGDPVKFSGYFSIYNLACPAFVRGGWILNGKRIISISYGKRGASRALGVISIVYSTRNFELNFTPTVRPLSDITLNLSYTGRRGFTFAAENDNNLRNGEKIGTIWAGALNTVPLTIKVPSNFPHGVNNFEVINVLWSGGGSVLFDDGDNSKNEGGGGIELQVYAQV